MTKTSAGKACLVETLIKKNPVYRGNAVDFCVDRVRLPDGRSATREYLDHPGAVGVVPFLDAKTVVLVRQYRHPVGEITLELPAGKLDRGEKALACVRRELREETGYSAGKIRFLLDYWPTPAFASERLHLFVAEGLVPGVHEPDCDEFIETEVLPFKRALGLVRSGKILDSKTVIGLLACAFWG
ncbi:MAG: NUDIX hydrolase [Elusimicrobia bacterium]|nr:NUDIX hydrolase [Elusimicrobiota bacterium]